MNNIEQLNNDFSIADQLEFIEGEGGFPFIKIDNSKAAALISVYAGQVLSYHPVNEPDDLLFLSSKAYYQEGKAIKGGIPICWPWFGPDPDELGRASHGFVRNRHWTVSGTDITPEGETKVALKLVDSVETRGIWPHTFNLLLEVLVGDSLTVKLVTHNTGDKSLRITQALHTYFNVGDISRAKILGLQNINYLDKVAAGQEKTQVDELTISEEVDRIYTGVQNDMTLDDTAIGRRIHISFAGSQTAVVWNPWAEIAAKMTDLENDDYKRFLCVETANAADEIVMIPSGGESHLVARYSISRLP